MANTVKVQGSKTVARARKGQDGKSYYTWIKYADNADGGGISDNPVAADGTLKKYIGFAYNKTTPTESNVASDYTWALFKGTDGTDGLPGKPGDDGTTYYTWIKYADALGSNGYPAEMYDTAKTTTEYIGIAVNQTERAEGTDPTAYSWSKFKGKDGKGIVSQVDYYAVSASKTEVPTDWTPNTPPSMTATLRYLWKYTLTTFTDGSTEQTSPCVVGVFGVDGLSYRYSKWVAGVEYRNDNNPYYRDSNGQGIIDVVYVNGITIYDPNSDTPPPAGYICRKTHTSGDTVTFSLEGNWTQEDNVFTSDTITGNNATWAKIKFKTTAANTKITVKITASSEANYDWGYVCGLDADFSTTSYLAKVSGTNTQTVEIAVPKPGEHFFYVGYTKDVSGDKNNDNTVVEIISVSPSPVPLAVGEYWTQMNSMAPILTALVLADRIKANAIDVGDLSANAAFITNLIAQSAFIEQLNTKNLKAKEITTENSGSGFLQMVGNVLQLFNSSGDERMKIHGGVLSSISGSTITEPSSNQSAVNSELFTKSTSDGAEFVVTKDIFSRTTTEERVLKLPQVNCRAELTYGSSNPSRAELTYGSSNPRGTDMHVMMMAEWLVDGTVRAPNQQILDAGPANTTDTQTIVIDSQIINLAAGSHTVKLRLKMVPINTSQMDDNDELWASISGKVTMDTITLATSIQKVEIASNGFRVALASNVYFSVYLSGTTNYIQMMNENYGLRITNTGIQKTTNGGSTWTSL